MPAVDPLRPNWYVLTLLLAVICIPAVALLWVGWRMLEQDRALATQRLQERLEHAADLQVTAMERRFADIESRFLAWTTHPPPLPADDAVILVARAGRVDAHPQHRLLWSPAPPEVEPESQRVWEQGEYLEYQRNDFLAASAEFRRLAASSDATVRAGALVRLARTLRKAQRLRDALAAYDALSGEEAVSVAGIPAALIASYGRVLVSRDMNGDLGEDAWRPIAKAFAVDLAGGRWRLDRPTYEFYASEIRGWLGDDARTLFRPDAVALSAAAETVWRQWGATVQKNGVPSRTLIEVEGRHFAVIQRHHSNGTVMLIAGPRFMAANWSSTAPPQVVIELTNAGGRPLIDGRPAAKPYAIRTANETGLPWTIRVASADPATDLAQLSVQRRLLITGLGLIVFLTAVGTYAVGRAVARELAVARLQSDFVAAVSHEFRTPLTAMRHLAEALETGGVTDADRRAKYYSALARETERLHRLVEGLLDFGRMEAGRREYRFEPIDAASLVEAAVAECRNGLIDGKYRIVIAPHTVEAGQRIVKGDRGALTRAMWNLIDNALKYSPPASRVDVEVTRCGDRVRMAVRDEGPGIAEDEQTTIFERFVRGSGARTMHVGGAGVGLAIVRHIVNAHHGEVTLTSTAGRGSIFAIDLPAETAEVQR